MNNNIKITDKNNPVVTAIEAEIQRITAIDLHTFITNHDALAVALYADDIDTCTELMDNAPTDIIASAACMAKGLQDDLWFIEENIKMGFFSEMAEKLLEIAETCYDYGARLSRVLFFFCCKAVEHNIDLEVCNSMRAFLRKFMEKYHYIDLPLPEIMLMAENNLKSNS